MYLALKYIEDLDLFAYSGISVVSNSLLAIENITHALYKREVSPIIIFIGNRLLEVHDELDLGFRTRWHPRK